ncbi:efflux RND transporter periplasmic adaptor subunit [Parapedobacter sp. ISTM3]|uniref:efflux RND transporter periplasmic adaptor subunit n=1 Tax=Parapedobacter sp. ISTM3 TaxID=2800130 RepID=UPI0019085D6F|nr:efflux RND transporter periplasmic adaptor subunit [Parapedobacter sp. ISTM3]MBK1439875.1 efflux RND transporter periplasmic adaptor subunit [Parapedobacter sp. ISTM3]
MKRIILAGVTLAGALFFLACGGGHSADDGHGHGASGEQEEEGHEEGAATIAVLNAEQLKAVGIQIGEIERRKINASITVVGRLEVPNFSKANATSLYGGVIQRLLVQVGSTVKKGQVIARIADPKFVQLQEEYLTLESRITFASQEQKRQQELNAGNAGALRNLQNAEAELNALQTRQASLKQQLGLMGLDPATLNKGNLQSSLPVKSPVGGTVSNVFAKVGSYVDVSSPVAEIVNNADIHVDLNVFEKDLPSIRVGQVVSFSLTNNPGRTYDAEVFSIGASFEGDGKSVPVHCTIKGDKTGLIDGMGINGQISHEDAEAPAVPNEAIVEADGKYYIFVVTDKEPEEGHEHGSEGDDGGGHSEGDGHEHGAEEEGSMNFEKIEVAKGESSLGYTAVTPVTELAAGTQIVTKGAFFINAKMSNTGGHSH